VTHPLPKQTRIRISGPGPRATERQHSCRRGGSSPERSGLDRPEGNPELRENHADARRQERTHWNQIHLSLGWCGIKDERRKRKRKRTSGSPGEGLQVPAGPWRGRIAALVKHLADGDTARSYRPYPETQSADEATTSNVPRGGVAGA
jgi:hypothetical protein